MSLSIKTSGKFGANKHNIWIANPRDHLTDFFDKVNILYESGLNVDDAEKIFNLHKTRFELHGYEKLARQNRHFLRP